MVLKPRGYPETRFVPGRMAMTCCAQDMQFLGFVTDYEDAGSLKDKETAYQLIAEANTLIEKANAAEKEILDIVEQKL